MSIKNKSLRNNLARLVTLSLSFAFIFSQFVIASGPNKDKKNKDRTGTPVIWQDPGDIGSRDLFYGRGSADRAPKEPFTFIEEDMNGSNPKFDVTDANGTKWKVKLGKEAQPETSVSHMLWAIGYFTDEDYYVPEFSVVGLKKLRRGENLVSKDGVIHGGRFKRSNKGEKKQDIWKWDSNPFLGTKELQGLKVMMLLFNNWDIKDINNKIIAVTNKEDGKTELHYEVSDLGATLGQTGGVLSRSRNNPGDYAKTKFVEEAKRPFIQFDYRGKQQALFKDITITQAKWIGDLMSRLSDQQLDDAFRAANYPEGERREMIGALKTRIAELDTLPQ